jgi:hypothetical protein
MNVFKNGEWITDAPVAWVRDQKDGVQTLSFTNLTTAKAWAARKSGFLVVLRNGHTEKPKDVVVLVWVNPISEPRPYTREVNGAKAWEFDAKVKRIVTSLIHKNPNWEGDNAFSNPMPLEEAMRFRKELMKKLEEADCPDGET